MPVSCQMVYHHDNCINTKKPFVHPCHLCSDKCPHQALSSYREIDPHKCTECGVCMAVCPTDGMTDRQIDKFFDYVTSVENVLLSCPQSYPGGYEIPCLGMFDRDTWILLMLLAKDKPVTIQTGVCAECDDKDACHNSVSFFKEIHSEWPEHGKVQIKVKPVTDDMPVEEVIPEAQQETTRRDALFGWRKRSMDKIEELFPTLTSDEKWPIPKSRTRLLQYLEEHPEEKAPYQAIVISDECTSCGVCASICPQGAITKRGDGNEEEIRMVFEPLKCVQCERCIVLCRPKAMSLQSKRLSGKLLKGKVMLHGGTSLHCEKCGKLIFERKEPRLCVACASTSGFDSFFN